MDQETKQEFQNISESIKTLTSIVKQNFNAQVEGFSKVNAKLEEHDNRFTGIDDKFNKIDDKFNKIDVRFNKIDDKFNKIDVRFNKIDDKFNKIDEDIENLALMTQRSFDELERKNDGKFDIVNHKIDQIQTNLDAFAHLHIKVDTELTIAQHNIQDLDERVTVLETVKN